MSKKFIDLANLKSNLEKFFTEVISPTFATKEDAENTYAKKAIYDDDTISLGRKADTTAGDCSIAFGLDVEASGVSSYAMGTRTKALGIYSYAHGYENTASGDYSYTEGRLTTASGPFSHAEGNTTTASRSGSHTEGLQTKASSNFQHVQGKYNVEDTNSKYAHIVGGGTSDKDRKNIHTLDWSGNAEYAGDVIATNESGDKVSLIKIDSDKRDKILSGRIIDYNNTGFYKVAIIDDPSEYSLISFGIDISNGSNYARNSVILRKAPGGFSIEGAINSNDFIRISRESDTSVGLYIKKYMLHAYTFYEIYNMVSEEGKATITKVSPTLASDNIEYLGINMYYTIFGKNAAVIAPENGGTGQTSLKKATKALLDSLDVGSSTTNSDEEYVITGSNSDSSDGLNGTFIRRPVKYLWAYVQKKLETLVGLYDDTKAGFWNGINSDIKDGSLMYRGTTDATNGGSVIFAKKNGQLSQIIDGHYYQNEGKYKVIDENNLSSHLHWNLLDTVDNSGTLNGMSWSKTFSTQKSFPDEICIRYEGNVPYQNTGTMDKNDSIIIPILNTDFNEEKTFNLRSLFSVTLKVSSSKFVLDIEVHEDNIDNMSITSFSVLYR